MNFIGVELHTPKRSDLEGLGVLSAVYIVVALVVGSSGLFQPATIASILIGVVSGNLAAACGCSIQKYGVRGVIVTAGFCLAMMSLCAALIYLIELI